MSNSQVIICGKVIPPIVTSQKALWRTFVHGDDEQGPYVACRLANRNPSKFYGWYVLVSPEDLPLMKDFNWCGNLSSVKGKVYTVEVRRRTTIDSKQYSIMLGREIWSRAHVGEVPQQVYRLGHPFDFRRVNLSRFPLDSQLRGITKHKDAWQVQMTLGNKPLYIGRTAYPDEGYRMFNRYLRKLKEEYPNDSRIQQLPYNKVEPKF